MLTQVRDYHVLFFASDDEAREFVGALRLFLGSVMGQPLLTCEPRVELWTARMEGGRRSYFASDGLLQAARDLELYPPVTGRVSAASLPGNRALVIGIADS